MSFSNSLDNHASVLVADASVIINLNATKQAPQIIKALPSSLVITDNAWLEIESGRAYGHLDADSLNELERSGLVCRVSLDDQALDIYESLIDGRAAKTLDDGEAATISFAVTTHAVALIDERKARSLCSQTFPSLEFASTTDVLMHPAILKSLGADARHDAIFNALVDARMRVPSQQVEAVKHLIGPHKVKRCTSLPKLASD